MESIRPALATLRLSIPRPATHPLYRCLHTSATLRATPLPHPSVPGPPPETPTPAPSDALYRVARKRKQAELLKQAREVRTTSSEKKTLLQKRFWKDVSVKRTDDGYQVLLDSRPVRTPAKEVLTLPPSKHQLATAIALEWDLLMSAQQALKEHYIPVTSLAARALDIQKADAAGDPRLRQGIIAMLMRYLATDTLLCWAPDNVLNEVPRQGLTLRQLQEKVATPIIGHLTTKVWPGVEIKPILDPDSIVPVPQPEMTKNIVRGWLTGVPAIELAGLERAVLATKSLLVGVRLVHEWGEAFAQSREAADAARFGIPEAEEASTLEVRWQTVQWGEVEDTHDVEKEDLRRQLGSVIILVSGESS
ncbi:F1-ATP synthase assembly protein [Lentithecium fluviatile CBS 122367]|uniref:F1-ATP synthase assembly protein n=1 Tax=Lentithecium fluviatile CBS 122367 TaxID=1168545 RepID=A0A6G1J031_9PLEO|nr:F1-ATP synthase assembly protein [Lentithecium fluviatile CBS 122367]